MIASWSERQPLTLWMLIMEMTQMDDGHIKDMAMRVHNIEKTLIDLQVAVTRIEANQTSFQKAVSVIGGVAATAIAGVLAKLLIQ